MSKSHNKKRNVGILYEQLLRKISCAMVDKDQQTAEKTVSILKKHFKPGTQLYGEFRVFNALVKTKVSSESLACRILDEAKKAARNHDPIKLRAEKSALIKEINYKLADPKFYHQRVKDYRSYATIQQMMNCWRRPSEDVDITRVSQYENSTVEWLMADHVPQALKDQRDPDVNSLTVKIMTEKFNGKYGAVLNEDQGEIIRRYALTDTIKDKGEFTSYLNTVKSSTLASLQKYSRLCENRVLNEKMSDVVENIKSFNPATVDDDSLAKFLLLSKLGQEIKGKGK